MKIFLSQYEMKKNQTVNATDDSEFEEGALIKIEDDLRNWGVADLKPWPRLGDLSLREEIQSKGVLYQRALVLAQEDLEARKNNVSLLQDKPIVNNWLWTDLQQHNNLESFTGTIKIKGGKQAQQVLTLIAKMIDLNIKMRLDFNGLLTPKDFNHFMESLSERMVQKIEYIEDPTTEMIGDWQAWDKKIPLAIDFAKGSAFENVNLWSYFIIKPSRQDATAIITQCKKLQKKFTLTSAMDHPVGVAHGLRYAQKFAENTSGFLTLDLYQKNDFADYFVQGGNSLNFSPKALAYSGIGMNETLEKLIWVPL